MLLILTAALLPLGLIALFASIQSAHVKRLQREADARVIASAEARQIDVLLLRGANLVRGTLALSDSEERDCTPLLEQDQSVFQVPVRLALFNGRGRLRCASPDFRPRRLPAPRAGIGIDALLVDAPAGLRFTVQGPSGGYGVGELPVALLQRVIPTAGDQGIRLSQGSTHLRLSAPTVSYPFGQRVEVNAPIAGGQASLELLVIVNPISAVEIVLVLLPLLMWASAAMIGWFVIDRFLVQPLEQLQRAVTSFGPGDHDFALPRLGGPSQEIRALGAAFATTAARLADREAALKEGLNHQVRLTREVHHRVKNNLQVVASLINLHARGTQGEVADAYASIQRRVDALAVVHRNHYAELEENRGVALRSLIAELTANLRATAPASAQHMTITLDMIPAFITQDVAVPVAFLVTEIVELVMTCDPTGRVAIALAPGATADRAILTIESNGLIAGRCGAGSGLDRFERIVIGLARQLRSQLDHDDTSGRYSIAIAILPQPAESDRAAPKAE
ncbi:sensor histidine kinase [Sphingomonas nostoxanthinifaciens]|uniref:sensor histidine kinase n=1 Tax=Sphingomonas nostoxanthinifaciens TaxID=2872652 RepID=UPI001CC1E951|nr:sensor histidine kinase [Sphingomonas nostoxanthinifaciens]UAK24709.1 sensor histidine kinase [Sphingomonas nostoxanthinifaciens]